MCWVGAVVRRPTVVPTHTSQPYTHALVRAPRRRVARVLLPLLVEGLAPRLGLLHQRRHVRAQQRLLPPHDRLLLLALLLLLHPPLRRRQLLQQLLLERPRVGDARRLLALPDAQRREAQLGPVQVFGGGVWCLVGVSGRASAGSGQAVFVFASNIEGSRSPAARLLLLLALVLLDAALDLVFLLERLPLRLALLLHHGCRARRRRLGAGLSNPGRCNR